jgi:hypothetical protein
MQEEKQASRLPPKTLPELAIATNVKLRNENSVLDLFFLFKEKRFNIHWGEKVGEKHLCCYFQGVEMLILTTKGVHLYKDDCYKANQFE